MSVNLKDAIRLGHHLPTFLRDFHDQKDVFKTIGGCFGVGAPAEISWADGQIYVIDRFLPFMAQHGYSLQQWRKQVEFADLRAAIEERREREAQQLHDYLTHGK